MCRSFVKVPVIFSARRGFRHAGTDVRNLGMNMLRKILGCGIGLGCGSCLGCGIGGRGQVWDADRFGNAEGVSKGRAGVLGGRPEYSICPA